MAEAAAFTVLPPNRGAGTMLRSGPKVSAAEKRRFMSGKVADIRAGARKEERRGKGTPPSEETELFKKTLREVLDWVTPQLGKNEQRQYEEARLRALGGTLEKRVKTPYNLLQQQRKAAEEKRQKILQEEEVLGVSMSASKHRAGWAVDKLLKKKKEDLKDKKRWREDGLLRLGMGAYEKRGMAVIPQRALRAVQSKGR